MKHLLLLLVIIAGTAKGQQFPVGVFKMYNSTDNYPGRPSHAAQLQKTMPLMQGAYFSYGQTFNHEISDAEVLQLLDSAAAHNIKIVLADYMEGKNGPGAGIERFYLDANSQYFTTINGSLTDPSFDPAAEHPSNFYDNTALKATVANDYMVKDVKIQPRHPWYYGLPYTAYFRLKVSRSGSPPPSTPVVEVEVRDVTTQTSYSITPVSSDFALDNTYYTFSISFNSSSHQVQTYAPIMNQSEDITPLDRPGAVSQNMNTLTVPNDFDFRVKWLGQIQVWLDNVRVEGPFYSGLDPSLFFAGNYDSQMKNTAKMFNNKVALARFYLKDEPYLTQFISSDKVNKLLRIAAQENGVDPSTGKGLGHAAKTEDDPGYGTYSRYTQEVAPYELATDIYRFWENDPLPSHPTYTTFAQNNAFQTAIDKFTLAQQNSQYAESRTWWYYPNISRFPGSTREPYLAEINAQVHLALSYGAKGILYFNYWTSPDGSTIGLADPITLDPINSSSQYSVYGENKWDGIKALNQKLAGTFGSTLMGLTWQAGLSIHQAQPTGTYITSITTTDAPSERYVELGVFKDASNNDYFMIVNRRTKTDETRNITVNFNNSISWGITDPSTGEVWLVNPYGNLSVNLSPGDGKLFKKTDYQTALLLLANQNKSTSQFATNGNNQRKLFRDANTNRLHEVFESAGEIFARFSHDNGSTWSGAVRLSDGSGLNYYPSVTARYNYFGWYYQTYAYAVWQKINGYSWDVIYNYSTDNGSSWLGSPITLITVNSGNHPQPGIMASTTSSSYELMIVYRDILDLKTAYTTSTSPSSGSWQIFTVNNTSSQSRSPSLACGTGYPFFRLVWNNDNVIYHQNFYGVNNWSGLTNVSSGAYTVSSQDYPSYALSGSQDKHIVWQGYYSYDETQAIIHNKNLSSLYNIIDEGFDGSFYHRPTVSSNPTYEATIFWFNNYNQILNTSVNGSELNNGTIVSTNSTNPSLSINNPPGGITKAVWTSGTTSPYSVQLGSPTFQKGTGQVFAWKTERFLNLSDSSSGGLVSIGFGSMFLKTTAGEKLFLPLKVVDDEGANIKDEPLEYLKTEKFILPENADSIDVEHFIHVNDVSGFAQNYDVSIHLVALDGQCLQLHSIPLSSVNGQRSEKIQNKFVAEDRMKFASRTVFVRMSLGNFTVNRKGLKFSLFNVHKPVRNGAESAKQIEVVNSQSSVLPANFAFENYPNPFNPTTRLRFDLPHEGHVVLRIFDVMGRQIAFLLDENRSAGFHEVVFDASRFASGIYFSTLEYSGKTTVRKLLLVK